MEKLKINIFLIMLCMIFLSSCQSDEKHPIFRQSADEIYKIYSDMMMHSFEFLRIEKQADNIEQEVEFYFFVYQISLVLTNMSIISELLSIDAQTDPNMAAYLFGMVDGLIYHNKKIIHQSSEFISSSDNQALNESYRKTIQYLNRINVILKPLEIHLIKASGEDPKKVKEQLESWWALAKGKR